ncbi:10936_t:CDS:2, partial [Gigaspora rosea]
CSLVESMGNNNPCCTMGAARRAQKRSNFLLAEKIADLIKTKNIINKVKKHSNNKWNDLVDKLAKKGCKASETIQIEVGENSRFQSVLYWEKLA